MYIWRIWHCLAKKKICLAYQNDSSNQPIQRGPVGSCHATWFCNLGRHSCPGGGHSKKSPVRCVPNTIGFQHHKIFGGFGGESEEMCQRLLKSHCKIFNLKVLKDLFFAAVMLNQPRTILQFSSCNRNSECCLCSFPVSHKDQKILKDADKQHVQISGDTSSTQLARIVTVLSRKGSPSHNENI